MPTNFVQNSSLPSLSVGAPISSSWSQVPLAQLCSSTMRWSSADHFICLTKTYCNIIRFTTNRKSFTQSLFGVNKMYIKHHSLWWDFILRNIEGSLEISSFWFSFWLRLLEKINLVVCPLLENLCSKGAGRRSHCTPKDVTTIREPISPSHRYILGVIFFPYNVMCLYFYLYRWLFSSNRLYLKF